MINSRQRVSLINCRGSSIFKQFQSFQIKLWCSVKHSRQMLFTVLFHRVMAINCFPMKKKCASNHMNLETKGQPINNSKFTFTEQA